MIATLPAPALTAVQLRIVQALRMHGPVAVDELRVFIGTASSTARMQLTSLEERGIVHRLRASRSRGRPRYLYRLTSAAEGLFPQGYGALAKELLGLCLEDNDGDFSKVWGRLNASQRAAAIVPSAHGELAERLERVVVAIESDGYLSRTEEMSPGVHLLHIYSCPIRELALSFSQICAAEATMIEQATGGAAKRVSHVADGATACDYLLRAANSRTTEGDRGAGSAAVGYSPD